MGKSHWFRLKVDGDKVPVKTHKTHTWTPARTHSLTCAVMGLLATVQSEFKVKLDVVCLCACVRVWSGKTVVQ